MNYKINILNIYYLIILTSSLVYGFIRIRIGAGWEIYIPFVFILTVSFLHYHHKIRKDMAIIFLMGMFALITNIVAYIYFFDKGLVDLFNPNITLETSMIVETIRFFVSISFVVVSLWLISSKERLLRTMYFFIVGSLFQALYGITEFILKFNGITYLLINDKSISMPNIIRAYGTFFEPSQFGIFIGASLFIYLIFLKIGVCSKYQKSLLFRYSKFFISVYVFAVLFSMSRAAFISLGIALIPLLVKNALKLKQYFYLLIIFLLLFYIYDSVPLIKMKLEYGFSLQEGEYENTLLNRLQSIFNLFGLFYERLSNYPLGVGVGVSTLLYSHTGALFKIVFELGMLNVILLIIILFYLVIYIINTKGVRAELFSLMVFLCVSLLNYDSYTHLWLYFAFLIIYLTYKFKGDIA